MIMYHPRRFQTLLVSAVFSIQLLGGSLPALAESGKPPLAGAVTTLGDPAWSLPPVAKQVKKRPKSVEIYQFDKSPIDNRAPLLMVHGLLGEYWADSFRWRKLATYLQNDPVFAKKYKIVFLRYDTKAPLQDVVPPFRKALEEVSSAFGGQPLNVVALSMGGNMMQMAMKDPTIDKRVKHVLTMGTPFHGSPLFSNKWMEYSMLRHYRSPISRLDTAFAYRMYFDRHKNLLSDLRWDNTDQFIPDVGNFRFYFPMPSHGDLTPSATANTYVASLNSDSDIDKSKFTVYGGYLLNDFATMKGNDFASILKIPYKVTFTLVPEHFGREHPVLRALNQHIARAIVSSPQTLKADGTRYAYGLNDGITPITSAIFLPNSALPGLAVTDATVDSLRKFVDVKRARVFRNIDHLTFIDDYHPLRSPSELRDQLSPEEAAKPIFEWIKNDLMDAKAIADHF
jgi:pimeloyl-ACP methyl ester carboxylesterase